MRAELDVWLGDPDETITVTRVPSGMPRHERLTIGIEQTGNEQSISVYGSPAQIDRLLDRIAAARKAEA